MNTFTAALAVARKVGAIWEGTATSGSTTTLVDTNQQTTVDDFYNGGTLFVVSGQNAGKTRVITDYVNTTRTWTVQALPYTMASGDRYAVLRPDYTRAALIAAINEALDEIGPLVKTDDTLLVLADTDEYYLPAGVSGVKRVEVAGNDAAPYAWQINHYWTEQDGMIMFQPGNAPTTEGKIIRLWYNQDHPKVYDDTDEIDEQIHVERLAWTAAVCAIKTRARQIEWDDKMEERIKQFSQTAAMRAIQFPVRKMPADPRFIW